MQNVYVLHPEDLKYINNVLDLNQNSPEIHAEKLKSCITIFKHCKNLENKFNYFDVWKYVTVILKLHLLICAGCKRSFMSQDFGSESGYWQDFGKKSRYPLKFVFFLFGFSIMAQLKAFPSAPPKTPDLT